MVIDELTKRKLQEICLLRLAAWKIVFRYMGRMHEAFYYTACHLRQFNITEALLLWGPVMTLDGSSLEEVYWCRRGSLIQTTTHRWNVYHFIFMRSEVPSIGKQSTRRRGKRPLSHWTNVNLAGDHLNSAENNLKSTQVQTNPINTRMEMHGFW